MTLTPMAPLWLLLPVFAILFALAGTRFAVAHRARAGSGEPRLALDWAVRFVLVLLLFVLALRPAIAGNAAGSSAAGGLEVYFVVDTTSSMAAEDFSDDGSPRLTGVKADIGGIARSLQGAQFALVTFDSSAVQRVPLTSDVSALRSSVSALTQEVTTYSAGSSIDGALDLMTRVLTEAKQENPDRPRVIFYFGDGEQTAATEPRSFASLASFVSGGAVLGYGTANGGRMLSNNGYGNRDTDPSYIQDYSTDPVTDGVSRIDEETLKTIATDLGVQYSLRAAGASVAPLVDGITVGTPSLASQPKGDPIEFYWLLAVPIGLLLLREAILVADALREIRPSRPDKARRDKRRREPS